MYVDGDRIDVPITRGTVNDRVSKRENESCTRVYVRKRLLQHLSVVFVCEYEKYWNREKVAKNITKQQQQRQPNIKTAVHA